MYDITDKRRAVALLQHYLRTLSHATDGMPHPPTDGFYDATTREAVLFFQRQRGLPPTGEVGFRDWQAIWQGYLQVLRDGVQGARQPLALGDAGNEVTLLQAALAAVADAYAGGVGAPRQSGRFDSETAAAVRLFQGRRLLPASGIADAATQAALPPELPPAT